ncbi:MAG TPA: hypothetical protein VK461_12990, partial [Acidimicrobiales bacterium]|nr:hypothetical protein [Acidimicrobiales bacterium]
MADPVRAGGNEVSGLTPDAQMTTTRPGGEMADQRPERLSLPPLPASGAWRPGDPVGRRQFLTLPRDRPFTLEGGGALDEI